MVGAVLVTGVILLLLYLGGRWLETRNAKPETRGDHLLRYAYGRDHGSGWRELSKEIGDHNNFAYGCGSGERHLCQWQSKWRPGDFLRLVAIDSTAKTVFQVQIDRDTMTPITILGVLGNRSGVRTTHICLAHSFGDGGAQSCELTVDAVSNLLFGSQIDYYVAMNLDGISVLNDWVGGVTVTLEDDFSALDAAMTQGTTLTLAGEQAEIYVRSRRNVGVGTNETRMKRQQEYISLLSSKLDAQGLAKARRKSRISMKRLSHI